MLKNTFSILFTTHYFTIIHYQLKSVVFEKGDREWLHSQLNLDYDKQSALEIYMKMLYENIKTPLGLGLLDSSNFVECLLSIFWMFLGLSM